MTWVSFGHDDRSRLSIIPIGSLHTGWALKVDGVIRRSNSSLISLGAYVDAIMAGASEADADNIARAIEARPWPTYEERMAVFSPAGPWSRRAIRSRSVEPAIDLTAERPIGDIVRRMRTVDCDTIIARDSRASS
jgi:hypothetical protein